MLFRFKSNRGSKSGSSMLQDFAIAKYSSELFAPRILLISKSTNSVRTKPLCFFTQFNASLLCKGSKSHNCTKSNAEFTFSPPGMFSSSCTIRIKLKSRKFKFQPIYFCDDCFSFTCFQKSLENHNFSKFSI